MRRAFEVFLTVPITVVGGFLLLAFAAYFIDTNAGPRDKWGQIWSLLDRYVGDADSATGLLETLAGSLITVTSITFSILLLAVQQGASSLTSQIFDQYLRRRSNQYYFGFFVGASLYTLLTLVLTNDSYRPVIGTTIAIVIAAVAMCALVILIHSTLNQTRSSTITASIQSATLSARSRQIEWLERTAQSSATRRPGRLLVSEVRGYLSKIDIEAIERLITEGSISAIEIIPSLGDYIQADGELAVIAQEVGEEASIDAAVRKALVIEERRDLNSDAAGGVGQLAIIAWSATSTAKSNPSAARNACNALADLLWEWGRQNQLSPPRRGHSLISYDDNVAEQLMDAFESLIVAASESMQHQTLGSVLGALTSAFDSLPIESKDRVEAIILNSLCALGDHLPTRVLEVRYRAVIDVLSADGRRAGARSVAEAWDRFASVRGTLQSRGSRHG